MTVLLLGSGAREHAQAWKLRQSPLVGRLVCAPGNPGIAEIAELRGANIEHPQEVVMLARELAADLVFIGPEQPLAAGVSDALREAGFTVFGPSKAAARLEWDKAFAKDFMRRHNVPTASSRTFNAMQLVEARNYVRTHPLPVVLKANGLTAGKGVVIAQSNDEAVATVEDMLSGNAFGGAGEEVVIEEFMYGDEASVFAITDSQQHYVTLAPSQDHKRVGTGDVGPNTGGMGAYAPAPIVTDEVMERVRREIIEPVLKGMADEGAPYSGCLYIGLMILDSVPRVVEFNSRFGDPETQVILPLLQSDFAELAVVSATGKINEYGQTISRGSAVCVVMASHGYPIAVRKGDAITGIEQAQQHQGITVFHAGTAMKDGHLVTNGGRVLGVTAVSKDDDMAGTIARAYEAVAEITFEGAHYRTDIGARLGGK